MCDVIKKEDIANSAYYYTKSDDSVTDNCLNGCDTV
jgi:hypothetical protein